MKRAKIIILAISLLVILTLLAGCMSIPLGEGKKVKLSRKGVEFDSGDGEKAALNIDTKEGNISITGTDSEGKEGSLNISADKKIPKEFPSDIPIPKEASVISTSKATIDGTLTVQLALKIENSKKDIEDYGDIYRDYLNKASYDTKLDMVQDDYLQLGGSRGEEEGNEDEMFTLMMLAAENELDLMISYSRIEN